jgi:hypothetical protein
VTYFAPKDRKLIVQAFYYRVYGVMSA